MAECIPGLRDAEVIDVAAASGVDTCWYDLVADDEFILGAVPGADGLYTGVGARGAGLQVRALGGSGSRPARAAAGHRL